MMAYDDTLWCETDVKEGQAGRRKLLKKHSIYYGTVTVDVFQSLLCAMTTERLKYPKVSTESVILCYLCFHGHHPRSFPPSTSHILLSHPERERQREDDRKIRT